ncbi:hypothetical protein N9137_00890 [Pseudomonadales bacterium]|nr:hypothetical protein [Pseudomonadales bacterium]
MEIKHGSIFDSVASAIVIPVSMEMVHPIIHTGVPHHVLFPTNIHLPEMSRSVLMRRGLYRLFNALNTPASLATIPSIAFSLSGFVLGGLNEKDVMTALESFDKAFSGSVEVWIYEQ